MKMVEDSFNQALRSGSQTFAAYNRQEQRHVEIRPFTARDFSSTTGVFPGQGIAFDGQFGDILKNQTRLRDYFLQADAFAQSKAWPRPSLYLTAPQRVNPAIQVKLRNLTLFTLEVGLFEELNRLGFTFKRLAGYSFGEYAGWTAAGVVSFAQMLEVIYWREALSPASFEAGTNILVGAEENKINEVLAGSEFYLGNRNLPAQNIIAVKTKDADAIVKKLFAARIACQKLNELVQPYHSPLMQPTADLLADKIKTLNLEVGSPRVPLYSSVLGRWVDAEHYSRREFIDVLSRQLVAPVNFLKLHSSLDDVGRQSVMELGPGESCSDLLRKFDRNETFRYLPLGNYFRGEAPVRKEFGEKVRKSKFVGVVSGVVARLTGYEIDDIVIEDRFQEDLGIDSLKKAEVMFEVLHAAKASVEGDLNTSRFKSLGDLVEYLEVGPAAGTTQASTEKIKAPFFRYEPGWQDQLSNLRLGRKSQHRDHQVELSRIFEDLPTLRRELLDAVVKLDQAPLLVIVDAPQVDNDWTLEQWTMFVRFWRDTLVETTNTDLKIALVGNVDHAVFEGCRAFFRSVANEQLHLTFLAVGCASAQRPSSAWLWEQIQRPRLADRRYAPESCEERAWLEARNLSGTFQPKSMAWLGGTGGIAYELLSRYPARAETHLRLLGRREESDIDVQDRLSMLELEYASVTYSQVDASDPVALARVLDQANAEIGNLELVVNATGVDRSAPLHAKVDEEIVDDLRQKILPARALAEWCAKNQSARQVHFSSIVGLFGNANQSVYAIGNASLAAQIKRSSHEALIVHWPAWQNVGMTARSAVRLALMESGAPLLEATEGAQFFWADIAAKRTGDVTYFTKPYVYQEQLRNVNFEGIEDFFGSIPEEGKRVIRKRFDLNSDVYLMDHRIQDKPCVPAAAVMVMFLELSYLLEGRFQPVREFEMTNMLIVDSDGQSANLALRPSREALEVQLRTLLPHARALLTTDGRERLQLKLPLLANASDEEIPMSHFYHSGVLFHGTRHQMLANTYKLDDRSMRGRVHRSDLAKIHGNDFFDVLMPVFDGVFQLLVISSYLQSKIRALPTGVESLRYYPEVSWTEDFWIQTDLEGLIDGVVQGNALVYNEHGEVIAEMRGIKVQEGTTAFAAKS